MASSTIATRPASSSRSTPTPSRSASSSRSCSGAAITVSARPTPASVLQHKPARRGPARCHGWDERGRVWCRRTIHGYNCRMSSPPSRLLVSITHLRALAHRYRLQLILALRVTVAALSALAVAQAMHLRLPLWAVLTSLIVTQMSLGRSLKVAGDYLMGTLAGVAYGGALAILIPHEHGFSLFAVLALAIAPLAFVAAFRTNFNVLPITAIIVLLVPSMQHVSPAASAFDRVLEVVVGGVTGFIVSFLVFPSRAHVQTTEAAAGTFDLVATALAEMLAHHTGSARPDI